MKKVYALFPAERERECDHPMGFPYTGRIPCTGPRVCSLCGTRIKDAEQEPEGFDRKQETRGLGGMRELIENRVISGYEEGLNEVQVAGHHGTDVNRWEFLFNLANSLENKRITIKAYVMCLSDAELLEAYTSQCCLRFR